MATYFLKHTGSVINWSDNGNWKTTVTGAVSAPAPPGSADTAVFVWAGFGYSASGSVLLTNDVEVSALNSNLYNTSSSISSSDQEKLSANHISHSSGQLNVISDFLVTPGIKNYNVYGGSLTLSYIGVSPGNPQINLYVEGSSTTTLGSFVDPDPSNLLYLNVSGDPLETTYSRVYFDFNPSTLYGTIRQEGAEVFYSLGTYNTYQIDIRDRSKISVPTSGVITNEGSLFLSGSITFNTTSLDVYSDSITLSANTDLSVLGFLSLNSQISGSNRIFTKSGSGSLVLSSANTYSGGTTLIDGGLYIFNGSSLGSGTLKIFGGTIGNYVTEDITISNDQQWHGDFYIKQPNTTKSITMSGPVSLYSDVVVSYDTYSCDLNLTGVISGSHDLRFNYLFTKLSANNTFLGTLTILGGQLEISSNSNLGNSGNDINLYYCDFLANGNVTLGSTRSIFLQNSVRFFINPGYTLAMNGPIEQGLTHQVQFISNGSSSTLYLSGDNTGLKSIYISNGITFINNANALPTDEDIITDGGAHLRFTAVPSATFALYMNGVNTLTDRNLSLQSSGVYKFSLDLQDTLKLECSSNSTISAPQPYDTINLHAQDAYFLTNDAKSLSILNRITNTSPSDVFINDASNSGVFNLYHLNNDMDGAVKINNGTCGIYKLANKNVSDSLGSNIPTNVVTIGNSYGAKTTLKISNSSLSTMSTNRDWVVGNNVSIDSSLDSLVLNGIFTYLSASSGTIELSGTGYGVNDFASILPVNVSPVHLTTVLKSGSNIWRLTNNNTFYGPVTVQDGSLVCTHVNSLGFGNGDVSVSHGASLVCEVSQNSYLRNINISGNGDVGNGYYGAIFSTTQSDTAIRNRIVLDDDATVGGSGGNRLTYWDLDTILNGFDLTIQALCPIITYSKVITGNGSVFKTGTGILELFHNEHSGDVEIRNGKCVAYVNSTGATPIPNTCTIKNNATLSIPTNNNGQNAKLIVPGAVSIEGGTIRFGGLAG